MPSTPGADPGVDAFGRPSAPQSTAQGSLPILRPAIQQPQCRLGGGTPAGRVLTVQGFRSRGRPPHAEADSPRGESGQALLELALVAPILILLIMAIFQFAYVFQTQMGLANAVREAARRAAAAEDPTEAFVRVQLCGTDLAACNDGLLAENVQGFDGAWLKPANSVSIAFCTYPVTFSSGTVANYRVKIDVHYRNPVFFPLLAYATDLLDGSDDGRWELSESADMRLEHDISTVTPC